MYAVPLPLVTLSHLSRAEAVKTEVASALVLQLYPPQCLGNLSGRIFLTAMLPIIIVAIVIPISALAGVMSANTLTC